jgi:hypothetical protein
MLQELANRINKLHAGFGLVRKRNPAILTVDGKAAAAYDFHTGRFAMRNRFLGALILTIALCAPVLAGDCINGACGCDNGFRGGVATYWPDAAATYESGVLFDAPADNGYTTWFNFNGRDYAVPDGAITVHVSYDTCTFHISYNGDPVFHDTER